MDAGNEELKPQIPTESNPIAFVAAFRQSNFYKKAEEDFFKGKTLSPKVTEEMKRNAFENNEKARLAFTEFGFKEKKFVYEPEQFSPEQQALFDNYFEKAKEERRLLTSPEGPEAYKKADGERRDAHEMFAKSLVAAGFIPNDAMGDILARLILLNKGVGDYESTRKRALSNLQASF